MQPPNPHIHHQLSCIPALSHECTYTLLIRSSFKVPLPARCTVTALLLSGLPTRARVSEGGFAPFKNLHRADISGAPTSGLRPRRGQNQPFGQTRRVLCGLSSPGSMGCAANTVLKTVRRRRTLLKNRTGPEFQNFPRVCWPTSSSTSVQVDLHLS